MSRVGHILPYLGAASLVTKTRFSMDRPTLDAAHLGSQSARDDTNPYFQLVMDFFNYRKYGFVSSLALCDPRCAASNVGRSIEKRVLVTNDAAPRYGRIWPTLDISSE